MSNESYTTDTLSHHCNQIDNYDIHSIWWPDVLNTLVDIANTNKLCTHTFFYGPPGVGKYSHALHFLRTQSPSHFNHSYIPPVQIYTNIPEPPRIKYIPEQQYIFRVSDVHIEIDMEQLVSYSEQTITAHHILTLWNEIMSVAMSFSYILCLNISRAPILLIRHLHSYMVPCWDQYKQKKQVPRFIFLGESICAIPKRMCDLVTTYVHFNRPSNHIYNTCIQQNMSIPSFVSTIQNNNITNIKELYDIAAKQNEPKIEQKKKKDDMPITNNKNKKTVEYNLFKLQCDKMVNIMCKLFDNTQIIHYPSEIRNVLHEWALYRICPEEGIWYVIGRCICENMLSNVNVKQLFKQLAHGSTHNNTSTETYMNTEYIYAEWMCFELVHTICSNKK